MFEEYSKLVLLKKQMQMLPLIQLSKLRQLTDSENEKLFALKIECKLLNELKLSVHYTDPQELVANCHKSYTEGIHNLQFPLVTEQPMDVNNSPSDYSPSAGIASLQG